ncbi:hypothetical protein [Streptomyces huasconensis]|uniref:hypothetical protein n=1 Tax=Streptomyces huasconensis TaxID=1854574 RepID=UPI0033FCCA3E
MEFKIAFFPPGALHAACSHMITSSERRIAASDLNSPSLEFPKTLITARVDPREWEARARGHCSGSNVPGLRNAHAHFGCPDTLHDAIHAEVQNRNAQFAEPLPAVEARAIANSIHRWITTRSRMWKDGAAVYEATFVAIQSARGKKGGEASETVRTARRDECTAAMLQYMRGTS